MDEDQTTVDSGPAWWQQTLDFVVKAAATKKFSTPQLQNGQSYYVDQNGNVVPTGQIINRVPGQLANTMASNPMVMLAGLALVGVVLYKLVK
ncbi:hypothetical protein [Noviherbaspirillum sp. Root189]|uniref:hypothetical protein n=1 Tax=Noviherbaspirillum sp. Root189 TaxID=1736487 RepID=UPI000710AAE6|nr:hypothetical protein [Noviherbaspirillum sp. Root189]KRB70492.1 hypothetical protein ASE07_07720 [Noviherbaspirillum sp. Root189]